MLRGLTRPRAELTRSLPSRVCTQTVVTCGEPVGLTVARCQKFLPSSACRTSSLSSMAGSMWFSFPLVAPLERKKIGREQVSRGASSCRKRPEVVSRAVLTYVAFCWQGVASSAPAGPSSPVGTATGISACLGVGTAAGRNDPCGRPQLPRYLRPLEIPVQGCVRHPVVGGDPPQALPGRPPANQLRIGNQPTEPIPRRFGDGAGGSIVVEGLNKDYRVDQAEDVLARAQSRRLEYRLHAGAVGDRLGGQLVVSAVQVGAGQRQPGVTLVEPGRIGGTAPAARGRTSRAHSANGPEPALQRDLLLRLPAHLPLHAPLQRSPLGGSPPLAPHQPPRA